MDNSVLKRFAARQRSALLAESDEKSAYTGFMRLCAAAAADSSFIAEMLSKPQELRPAFFLEKCRNLAEIYKGIFSLYGELPVPPQLLADGGTAAELLEYCGDFGDRSVLGRLHQYYNEPYRNEIAVGLKSSKRLSADKIAAATQIFTPEWIVCYMVQNTLIRYVRSHGIEAEKGGYYFSDDKKTEKAAKLEDIRLIDPCMGCGNILLYAFDVLMELYRKKGCSRRIAAENVLKFNLFGLELDERACAVAETALRLKAAEYEAFTAPQVYDFSGVSDSIGSLIKSDELTGNDAKSANIGKLLKQKYAIIVTNPPYLGRSAMNSELSAYIGMHYSDYGADLFSAFMIRCTEMCEKDGYIGLLTPSTWLFLQSYEKLRRRIYADHSLQTLLHFEYSAFDDATVPLCAFTLKNGKNSEKGTYLRLSDFKGDMEIQKEKCLEGINDMNCGYRYEADTSDFMHIPSAPAAYWLSRPMLRCFYGELLGDVIPVKEGLITGDNDRFLRRWYEVDRNKTAFVVSQDKKWFLLDKGGEYRKWFGNREYVVNWENDGKEIKNYRDSKGKLRSRPQGLGYNFKPSVSWSQITSGELSVRYFDENFMFNVAGTSAFPSDERQLLLLLGLLNSKVASELARVLNPTLNMNPGDLARLPLPVFPADCSEAEKLIRENIALCGDDWNSFETSYEFRRHPLV